MRPLLAFWVDNLDPFLVRIYGNFGIRYYGLAYVSGFAVAAWLLYAYAKRGRSRQPADKAIDLMAVVALGVVLGGRLGSYLLYDGWRSFPSDPFGILKIWEGGMAFHGGLIGVVVALAVYARMERIPAAHLWDLMASAAPVGLFFGRVANFINGELWGRPSTVAWAVIFPRSGEPERAGPLVPRHPSQLYEAGMEGLLLLAYMQWRFWKSDVVRDRPGQLGGEFLVVYGLARIAGETFREPDASLILGLSRGTAYSLAMIACGLAIVVRSVASAPRTA